MWDARTTAKKIPNLEASGYNPVVLYKDDQKNS